MRWKNICWNANSTHKSDKEMIRRNGWEKLVNDDSLNLFVPQRHKQHDSWTFKYFYLLIQLRLLLLILIYIGIDDAMRFEYVHVQCSRILRRKKKQKKNSSSIAYMVRTNEFLLYRDKTRPTRKFIFLCYRHVFLYIQQYPRV